MHRPFLGPKILVLSKKNWIYKEQGIRGIPVTIGPVENYFGSRLKLFFGPIERQSISHVESFFFQNFLVTELTKMGPIFKVNFHIEKKKVFSPCPNLFWILKTARNQF